MEKASRVFLVLLIVSLALAACAAQPTQISEPPSAPDDLPRSVAEVPRISVEDARAALDRGAAVIVDVRDPAAFDSQHIAGALSIPLGTIEQNPSGVPLEKEQWIITYCT